MDRNEPKQWHKDYSKLLECWAMIKTSELLKEKANNQLKSFLAKDKALNRLNNFIERIEPKTTLNQTIDLWQQTIDQLLKESNYQAVAECLESLSNILLNYGSEEQKKEGLQTLLRASKYYKRANEKNKAIVVIKRALTLMEISPQRDLNAIIERYEECGTLYKALNLHHLSKLSHKIGDFFGEITPYIKNTQKESIAVSVNHSKNCDHKCAKCCAQSSKGNAVSSSESSSSASDSDEIGSKLKEIDSKELVQKQIKKMLKNNMIAHTTSATTNATTCAPIDDNSDYPNSDSESEEVVVKPKIKSGSKQLLRQNLTNIFRNSSKSCADSEKSSDERCDESTPKRSKFSNSITSEERRLTTQITVAPQISSPTPPPPPSSQIDLQSIGGQNSVDCESKSKRKRRHKPKEESEEVPKNRLLKLCRDKISHYFQVDPRNPLKRLLCGLCNDSVLSYRWSTIVDHLATKKHRQLVMEFYVSQNAINEENMNCDKCYTFEEVYNAYEMTGWQQIDQQIESNACNKAIQPDMNLEQMPSTSTQMDSMPIDNQANYLSLSPLFDSLLSPIYETNHENGCLPLDTPPFNTFPIN